MLKTTLSQKEIAAALGFSPSTISRELKRNGGRKQYKAKLAQQRYEMTRKASGDRKSFPIELYAFVKESIKCLSPDAIAGRLRLTHPDPAWHVSGQTIYNWIYSGRLGKGLTKFLLFGKKRYKSGNIKQISTQGGKKRVDMLPKEARNGSRFGDWQGDTIIGAKHKGAAITLVEIKSKYILMKPLLNRTKDAFSKALQWLFADFNNEFLKSILFDNGSEMLNYSTDEEMLQCPIYFSYPGRPWEKGLIENSNRLLRRFFPKSTDFRKVSDEKAVQAIEFLNNMPRKSLGYRTAHEVLFGLEPIAFDT